MQNEIFGIVFARQEVRLVYTKRVKRKLYLLAEEQPQQAGRVNRESHGVGQPQQPKGFAAKKIRC